MRFLPLPAPALILLMTILASCAAPPLRPVVPDAPAPPPGPQIIYGGTFPDPHVFPYMGAFHIFSTHGKMIRTRTFAPDDITTFTLDLDFGPEAGRAHDVWAVRLYEHTDGSLHLYASLHYGWFRTVVAHFAPAPDERWTPDRPILKWRLNSILAGDYEEKRNAYDGIVFRDTVAKTGPGSQGDRRIWNGSGQGNGQDTPGDLYLIYTAVPPEAGLDKNNHIVIRRLLDPATPDPDFPPRVILSPEGLRSEDRDEGGFQLVEGPLLYKFNGKYLLSYSVGAFDLPNYKNGLAWSDSILPPAGKRYHKIWREDDADIWDNTKRNQNQRREIEYIMQSEETDWPNNLSPWLIGPGHANLVEIEGWPWLVFHARTLDETPDPAEARCLWRVPADIHVGDGIKPNRWVTPMLR